MNGLINSNGYKVVNTDDSSKTLWSERFNEHCHSISGARGETNHNYIQATSLLEKVKIKKHITVLEVGHGTGIGYHQTALMIEQNFSPCSLEFISMEIDEQLVEWSKQQNYQTLNVFPKISSLKKNSAGNYHCHTPSGKYTVLVGDALATLPKHLAQIPPIDIIYQDPFSPKNNPTLWTKEWFELLYHVAAPNCVMTTYSSAGKVSKAMIEAGWQVEKFPGFAKKKEGIRANKNSFLNAQFDLQEEDE